MFKKDRREEADNRYENVTPDDEKFLNQCVLQYDEKKKREEAFENEDKEALKNEDKEALKNEDKEVLKNEDKEAFGNKDKESDEDKEAFEDKGEKNQ